MKLYERSLVEEILTKRPYVKHLTLALFEGALPKSLDSAKLARECLKSLTAEDLIQLNEQR